jgi:hypothetical protein
MTVPDEAEIPTATDAPTEADSGAPKARPPKAPPGMLTRPTDHAARPGFRSPANARSKAQKKKK